MTQQSVAQSGSKAIKLDEQGQHRQLLEKLFDLYADTFVHDGYGDIRIEFKILRRGQKEVILHCGKQYRYVLDCAEALKDESPIKAILKRDILA